MLPLPAPLCTPTHKLKQKTEAQTENRKHWQKRLPTPARLCTPTQQKRQNQREKDDNKQKIPTKKKHDLCRCKWGAWDDCSVFFLSFFCFCSALALHMHVLEHGSLYTFAKGYSAYLHLESAFLTVYILPFSSNFSCIVCLIVAFSVCLLHE